VIGLSLATVSLFRERAARKQASQEAATAWAVNDFLSKDIIGNADAALQVQAGFTPNPNLTVREALERAAARIGDRFKDRPLQEAGVRFALGSAFRALGEMERAVAHFQRALDLARVKLGPTNPNTLNSMDALAGVYLFAGKLDQALQLFEEALKLRKATLGPDNRETPKLANLRKQPTLNGKPSTFLRTRTTDDLTARLKLYESNIPFRE